MALEFASRKETFPNYRKFETTFAGRPFVVETGKMCGLSNGSAMIRYGETCVLCNVTMSEKPREGIDFFPLSVEFEEKLYAAGRIPGSFMRREGRPGEHAILNSRVVDRPIRPLFPKEMRNDVCVTMTVMSLDPDNSPEIAGMNGASLVIAMSDIPWRGPIGGVQVGLVDGEIVLNPTAAQREKSDLALTLAASEEKIVMIEAGANEVDEDTMMAAIKAGHAEIKKMLAFINSIVAEIGKPKVDFQSADLDMELLADVKAKHLDEFKAAMDTDDKNVRDAALLPIMDKIAEEHPELDAATLDYISYKMQKQVVRRWLLDEGKRVDGRGINEIRPLAAEVGILPRVHGSGMFTRGQTQVLTICTLGSTKDAQTMDDLSDTAAKRYIHHYNMPPYSTGEARAPRSPRPPRDRPRRLGGARPDPGAALHGGLPLHHPLRLRGAVLQRLHLSGFHLRLHAGFDGRRRAHQGAGRRHLLRPDHRGRPLDDHAGHPGRRGLPRRHGLQGGRHPPRHHRHPDGHQDRRPDLRDR